MTQVANSSRRADCILLNFFALFHKEAPFYWQFGNGGTIIGNFGGTILLGKFGRRLVEIFFYVFHYAGGWLEFDFDFGEG